jgi:uncharacterized membrane protein
VTVRQNTPAQAPARGAVRVAALLLTLAGLAVSTYLTIAHYATSDVLLCNSNGVVDCESVTTSPESQVFGVPVADLGVLYFVGMAALCLPWAWRAANPLVSRLRLAGAGVGVLFVVYLVTAELVLIGRICLWCTAVHVITVALAVLLLTTALRRVEPAS